MVDGGTDFAFSVGKPAFRQHLALVSSLNTHIFLFHLIHLRMGGVDDLMDRSGKRIVPQASVGAFLHFFKVKLRLAFSGCLVKIRSVRRTFFVGMVAFAASNLSAARSERSMYFPSAGSARSSSVNCRREDGRCLAAEPSRTAWVSAFSAFRVLFFSWCSAARRARSAAAPADSSEEADSSVSGSRPLICSTSPVARFPTPHRHGSFSA